jgi:hypothetical protein
MEAGFPNWIKHRRLISGSLFALVVKFRCVITANVRAAKTVVFSPLGLAKYRDRL